MDVKIETLPSEGYLTESETTDGRKDIEEQISDFVIKVGDEVYLLECQSYDDNSMAIRIAEYVFIVARQFAAWDIGHAVIPMPRFAIIYIKRTDNTPRITVITYIFPDGQKVEYESENVILEAFTKEDIIEKRLFPYIPFYIARYEKDISSGHSIENVVKDLEYFRDQILWLHKGGELSDIEVVDLMGFVNTIITHITNGNKNEERLVNIMGGTVIETESEKLIRKGRVEGRVRGRAEGRTEGRAEEIIEMGWEFGLDDAAILKKLQERIGFSLETAAACLEEHRKQLVQ